MGYVGHMPCPLGCGKEAAVTHSKTGVRNVKCAPPCSFSGYGPIGSKSARLIDQKTIKDDDEDAAPAPAGQVAAPVKKAAGSGLLIG